MADSVLVRHDPLTQAAEAFRRGQEARRGRPQLEDGRTAARQLSIGEQLQEAEQEILVLKAANAKLLATAEAYRRRAELAEQACLDAVKRAYSFVAGR